MEKKSIYNTEDPTVPDQDTEDQEEIDWSKRMADLFRLYEEKTNGDPQIIEWLKFFYGLPKDYKIGDKVDFDK